MITLNPDGTATLKMGEHEQKIDSPLATDYVHLVEKWDELTGGIEDWRLHVRKVQLQRQEAVTKDPTSEESLTLSRELREATSELVRLVQSRNVEWLEEMLSTLQGWGTLDRTKLPATVYDPQWPLDLMGHWTLRPSVPGAQ
jgi:hypothetical protein